MLVRYRVLFYFILVALLLLSEAGALTSYAAGSQPDSRQNTLSMRFLNLYAGFKNNHFHLKLGTHYDVLNGVGTPEKLYHHLRGQWWSHLFWFLFSKLLPSSAVPYPSFHRGVPSLSRAFGSSADCNPHSVIMEHPMLSSRFSVKTNCLDDQPVWQVTAAPSASVSSFERAPESVQGRSLKTWLLLWKRLNDSNISNLFLRPWRDREENHLQAIVCPANPSPQNSGKPCQSVHIDFPLNHASPWLLPELARKEAVSPHGQTALDSAWLALVSQAIGCLSTSERKQASDNKGPYACSGNRWLYRLSDNKWVYKAGIPECPLKTGSALLTGKYLNIHALEPLSQKRESPENKAQPIWAQSSLLIARNDQHRKYHLWGAGDPVLVMQFPDKPYDIKERYSAWDRPEIGNLVEYQYLNLATFFLNTVPGTPFNVYQLYGALSGFRSAPVAKSLGDRVREQILRDPPSIYEYAKKRPEHRERIKNYLARELPGHPVNDYFSESVNPAFASQVTPFADAPSTNQAALHDSSVLIFEVMNTPSDASGNNQPGSSEAPQLSTKLITTKNGYRSQHGSLKKREENDEEDKERPPSGSGQKLHDIPSSLTIWDHLAHLHEAYHLEHGIIEPVSDFIQNAESFRSGKIFNPANTMHMQQVAAALDSSFQVIVPNGYERYRSYASDPQKSLAPQRMDGIKADKIILLDGDQAVSLSYFTPGSRDFPWLPHFLDSAGLNEKETAWLESNHRKKIFWQIFPEWKQHVLLSRESLGCDSIAFASDLLQQAFTKPSAFMKGEHWQSLFRVYNELGIISYPFDLKEEGTQTRFLINKSMLGAVLNFWTGAAKRYVPVLFPELDASTIDSQMTALKDYITDFSTGALLVKEQHFSYVIPTLLVLAPVVKKIHTTAMEKLQTRRALVYGGAARRKHILSRINLAEISKTPLAGDIDLGLENSVLLQDFTAAVEKQLQDALPGTQVRSINLGLKAIPSQQGGAVTTEKIIISLNENRDMDQKESWRVFSVDISSATSEKYFDFSQAEPYLPNSELLVPNISATVNRLLHDLLILKHYSGEDKERREINTYNALKMLLAYDDNQQVQAIIRSTLTEKPDRFGELPGFLQPFTESLTAYEAESVENPHLSASSDSTDSGKKKKKRKKKKKEKSKIPAALTSKATGVKTAEQGHEPDKQPSVEIKESADGECLTEKEEAQPVREERFPSPLQTLVASSEMTHAETGNSDAVPVDNNKNLAATENNESAQKKKKKKNAVQKKTPPTLDIKAGEQKSEEVSHWMESMEKRFLDALPQNKESKPCDPTETDSLLPHPAAEFDVLAHLETGLLSTTQLLACSGSQVDTTGSHPVIAINLKDNLAQALDEQQRKALDKAALEYHFPYAKLVQALLLLNQKYSPNDQKKLLQVYETAYGLLVPAALAGIPVAYRLLLGLQLNRHHPVGWPQLESANQLLRQWAARDTGSALITMNGLQTGGLLEQLVQDTDLTHLMAIEQGVGEESELSDRGKKVYDILKVLRKPKKERINALKEVRPQHFPELLQSIGLLKLLSGKAQEPAAKQSGTELWSYSLNAMGLGGTSKKKNAQPRTLPDAPQVLVMSDLAALKGMGSIAALFKGHQGNEIMFGRARLWERYQGLSLKESKDEIQSRFRELFSEISDFPVEKVRPGLIRDWILARSFLASGKVGQPPIASLESGVQAPENESPHKTPKKTVKKREHQQQQPDPIQQAASQLKKVAEDTNVLGIGGVSRATQKKEKTDSRPPPQFIDDTQQLFYFLYYLDIGLVQAVKSMEYDSMFSAKFENLAVIYARKALAEQKELDIFLAGYYYFLTALALLDAKMSSDHRIIKLTISPEIYADPERITNLLKEAELCNVPYAMILKDIFVYRTTGTVDALLIRCFVSALSGVSQGIELFTQVEIEASTLFGLLLKRLMQFPRRFELKLSIDTKPESTHIKTIFVNPGEDTSASLLLREFLEQIPLKGSDRALDHIINRIGKGFLHSPHLAGASPEEAVTWANTAEGCLRVALHIATGRKEVLESGDQKLPPLQSVSQYVMSDFSPAEVESLNKRASDLNSMSDEDGLLMKEMSELALYLTNVGKTVPSLAYFNTMAFPERERIIATIFGSNLRLLKKARLWMFQEDFDRDMPMQYMTVLAHLRLMQQSRGYTKDIVSFLKLFKVPNGGIYHFQKQGEHEMRNILLVKKNIDPPIPRQPRNDMPEALNVDSLRAFAKGDDLFLINAIKHVKDKKYAQLIPLLIQYQGKTGPEPILMSGWLNCLAGLHMVDAEALSDDSVKFNANNPSALRKAHLHFDKARKAGFPYAAYLDALVLMRLNDHYQFREGQTFKKSRTIIPDLNIKQASSRKEGEFLYIEAGNILEDILPLVLESALLGVRPAADIVIKLFTSDWFNLLKIPQAGWPSRMVKWLLTAPQNHNIHFSFGDEGTETEDVLFSKSDPDCISGILLAPIDILRQEPSIEERLNGYDQQLQQLIYESDKPEKIKKYLRLIRAFMLDKPEVLLDVGHVDSDMALTKLILMEEAFNRFSYKGDELQTLQKMPDFDTYFDDYVFNLPFLEFLSDHIPWQESLGIRHRTKSKLINGYFWAYHVAVNARDSHSDTFLREIIPNIDVMKSAFTILLATGDLTSGHNAERRGMYRTFKKYQDDIKPWISYLKMVNWLNAWSRGHEIIQGIQRSELEAMKTKHDTRHRLLPLQLWHEHWSIPDHNQ